MKQYGTKILYGILIIGFIISIIHAFNDSGGSAFGNIIETLIIISLLIFIVSIAYLLFSFKYYSNKVSFWILFLASCPLSINYIRYSAAELYLELIDTTTPKEYVYNLKVDSSKYQADKIRLQNQVDSLIKIKIIQKPSELARRYFNGQFFNDSIERDWAIDLPTGLDYMETVIDTLFYAENGNDVIAGLLINKVYNDYMNYPNGGVEFIGRGFIYDKTEIKPFKLLRNSVSGHETYETCSDKLRYFYLKKIGSYKNRLNMNDIRFLYGEK